MTTINDILLKNIHDYKKAKLIEVILLENGLKCFVEVDSKFVRIEELEIHTLTKEKLSEIFDLEYIENGKIKTEIGIFNVYYIPIPF